MELDLNVKLSAGILRTTNHVPAVSHDQIVVVLLTASAIVLMRWFTDLRLATRACKNT
jgi:hypothetical protein